MLNNNDNDPLNNILAHYLTLGFKIELHPKNVKNINFRLKSLNQKEEPLFTTLMLVSYPAHLPTKSLVQSLQDRLTWAIDCQQKQAKRQESSPKKSIYFNDIKDLEGLTLDSEVYFEGQKISVQALFERYFHATDFSGTDIARSLVSIYKFWLSRYIVSHQQFWQDKVGKSASKITPYTMKTRWGSCSTNARTIRLSIWLAQFEPRCTAYVMVHELCHLHEANHSARFWGHVERVMPDYQSWHNQLKYNHQYSLEDDI